MLVAARLSARSNYQSMMWWAYAKLWLLREVFSCPIIITCSYDCSLPRLHHNHTTSFPKSSSIFSIVDPLLHFPGYFIKWVTHHRPSLPVKHRQRSFLALEIHWYPQGGLQIWCSRCWSRILWCIRHWTYLGCSVAGPSRSEHTVFVSSCKWGRTPKHR